jgi:hypothetical protein
LVCYTPKIWQPWLAWLFLQSRVKPNGETLNKRHRLFRKIIYDFK